MRQFLIGALVLLIIIVILLAAAPVPQSSSQKSTCVGLFNVGSCNNITLQNQSQSHSRSVLDDVADFTADLFRLFVYVAGAVMLIFIVIAFLARR